MNVKKVYETWSSLSIVKRVMIGLITGLTLSLIIPGVPYISLLGDIFINALRAVAPFLILFIVMNSLSKSRKGLGKRFKVVLCLYLLSSITSSIIAAMVCMSFPITVNLDVEVGEIVHIDEMSDLVSAIVLGAVTNPIFAISQGQYLGILFWAIILGVVMNSVATKNTLDLVQNITDIISRVISIVINFAPAGVLGIIYKTVSKYGLEVFAEYGTLICILIFCMLVVTLITNPILSALAMRKNPYPLQFRCLRDSGIPAFCTRSSAANIPVNMKLCNDLGVDKNFASVAIPLGSSINLDGAAITITVLTLVAANTVGLVIPLEFTIALCIMSTLASCGTSGVSGGSLLLIPLACSLFGIGEDIAMQMVAIGFTISVIQDSLETALNSSSDVLFTTSADVFGRRRDGEDFNPKV